MELQSALVAVGMHHHDASAPAVMQQLCSKGTDTHVYRQAASNQWVRMQSQQDL